MKLSNMQSALMQALMAGATLKSHRDLDGQKIYRLYPLDDAPRTVSNTLVNDLKQQRLIDSNKKFPAATYLLTERGRRLAESLGRSVLNPLTAKNY